MKALIQRVSQARVEVDGDVVGAIEQGLLIFLGVEHDDEPRHAQRLAERICGYRVFSDAGDKMNLDLRDIGGSALVVSQFTLVADTGKGRRPSFSSAAQPEQAQALYDKFCEQVSRCGVKVERGRFAADMKVHLVNDGPVTFLLSV